LDNPPFIQCETRGSQESESHTSLTSSTTSSTSYPSSGLTGEHDGKTISAVFREKYGANATDRVYGFTTESLDFLRDNPDIIIPGPNPTRIPHDEVQNALNGFQNMYLCHEIAIDDNFCLENYTQSQTKYEFCPVILSFYLIFMQSVTFSMRCL